MVQIIDDVLGTFEAEALKSARRVLERARHAAAKLTGRVAP